MEQGFLAPDHLGAGCRQGRSGKISLDHGNGSIEPFLKIEAKRPDVLAVDQV
jgi:hypothetical protein